MIQTANRNQMLWSEVLARTIRGLTAQRCHGTGSNLLMSLLITCFSERWTEHRVITGSRCFISRDTDHPLPWITFARICTTLSSLTVTDSLSSDLKRRGEGQPMVNVLVNLDWSSTNP